MVHKALQEVGVPEHLCGDIVVHVGYLKDLGDSAAHEKRPSMSEVDLRQILAEDEEEAEEAEETVINDALMDLLRQLGFVDNAGMIRIVQPRK